MEHVRRNRLCDALQRFRIDALEADVGRGGTAVARSASGHTARRLIATPGRDGRARNGIAEVLLEPAEERRQRVEDLSAEAETFRGHRDVLVFGVRARQVGQHEFARIIARRRREIVNFARILLLVVFDDLFGALPLFALRVVLIADTQVSEVSKSVNISGVAGHGIDVTGDDFVQVLELFVVDPERLTETERVLFAFFAHVDVLTDAVADLPRDRQVIGAFTRGTYDDVALVHRRHQLLGLFERDVLERRMDDDPRRVTLTELLLLALLFGPADAVFGRSVVIGILGWTPLAVLVHQIRRFGSRCYRETFHVDFGDAAVDGLPGAHPVFRIRYFRVRETFHGDETR